MNPHGMFENGHRKREYTGRDVLPLSGRLIPEFDKRRSIKDMLSRAGSFPKKSPTPSQESSDISGPVGAVSSLPGVNDNGKENVTGIPLKRSSGVLSSSAAAASRQAPAKRTKTTGKSSTGSATLPGQKSLKGFFKSQNTAPASDTARDNDRKPATTATTATTTTTTTTTTTPAATTSTARDDDCPAGDSKTAPRVDRTASKENWTRLFTKSPPRCEGHEEPCISLTTKKAGINCGRQFWICARPVGPSGNKEKGTQWRCSTFIWASDW